MRDLEKGGRKGKREIKTWEGGVGKQTPVSPAWAGISLEASSLADGSHDNQ